MSYQAISVPPEMLTLIQRRTERIAREFISFDHSLRHALTSAYITGMVDAVDVIDNAKESYHG